MTAPGWRLAAPWWRLHAAVVGVVGATRAIGRLRQWRDTAPAWRLSLTRWGLDLYGVVQVWPCDWPRRPGWHLVRPVGPGWRWGLQVARRSWHAYLAVSRAV